MIQCKKNIHACNMKAICPDSKVRQRLTCLIRTCQLTPPPRLLVMATWMNKEQFSIGSPVLDSNLICR